MTDKGLVLGSLMVVIEKYLAVCAVYSMRGQSSRMLVARLEEDPRLSESR